MRPTPEFFLIEEVEARRTAFIRRAAGPAHASQCVAANIDVCLSVIYPTINSKGISWVRKSEHGASRRPRAKTARALAE